MAVDIRVRGKWAGAWVGVGQGLWGGPRILGGVLSISLFIRFFKIKIKLKLSTRGSIGFNYI